MLPELKLKFAFPGFGQIEIVGEIIGTDENFRSVSIKFTPAEPCEEKQGVLITLRRNGNCFTQEIKALTEEADFEGIGVA